MTTPYQNDRLTELLNDMAKVVVEAKKPDGHPMERNARALGRIDYMVWEARKILHLPDVDGLAPL